MTPHLLIFDLDGTLMDSASHVTHATNAALRLARAGQVTDAQVGAQLIGEPLPVLLPRAVLLAGWDEGALREMTDAYRATYMQMRHTSADLYHGVTRVLQRAAAAGVHMAICTNKNRPATEQALADTGLASYFTMVCCGDDPRPPKPSPAPLHHILTQLNVRPADAVMIGDGVHDRTAAHAAGVPFLAALWGYGLKEAEGDLTARTPDEMLSLLRLP